MAPIVQTEETIVPTAREIAPLMKKMKKRKIPRLYEPEKPNITGMHEPENAVTTEIYEEICRLTMRHVRQQQMK